MNRFSRRPALFVARPAGSRRWPLVAGPLGAAVLALGVAQSLAVDLRAAGGALARLAPPVYGVLVFAALLTLLATAPRRLLAMDAAVLATAAALSVAAALLSPDEASPRLEAFGQAAHASCFVALLSAAASFLYLRLKARGFVRASLGDYRSWLILALCALGATAAHVLGSTRILSWDPIQYWSRTDWVAARLLSDPAGTLRVSLLSAADDYSMIPALLPGVLTALAPQRLLLGYMLSIAVCYFVPALLACGGLGLALAKSADPLLAAAPKRRQLDLVAVGAVAVLAALPAFPLAFLDSAMLDSGGVVLLAAFALLWARVLKLVCMRQAHDETTRACDLFATAAAIAALALLIFTFRRWYIFDVIGYSVAALLYLLAAVWRREGSFRELLRDLALAGASATLFVLVCGEWILAQWIIQADGRHYAESYAAFWLGWPEELCALYRNLGIAIPLLCLAGLAGFVFRRGAGALPFLLLLGSLFAVAGFLCVQGMSPHHYYIFLPALAASAAAGGILIAHRMGVGIAMIALTALLCGMALAPRVGALAWVQPAGATLWPKRIVDAEEFRRLGHWLDGALAPEERYCLAASIWHVNGSVMSNIWQLEPSLKGGAAETREIVLPGVDTRDGPPNKRMQQCAIMFAATPPQTHLRPDDQQAILLVDHDMLTGEGIGRAFERVGEEFHLAEGLTLIAYRRMRLVSDEEVSELRRRFYATKGVRAHRFTERFGAP